MWGEKNGEKDGRGLVVRNGDEGLLDTKFVF
jgi:hypothetical protein